MPDAGTIAEPAKDVTAPATGATRPARGTRIKRKPATGADGVLIPESYK